MQPRSYFSAAFRAKYGLEHLPADDLRLQLVCQSIKQRRGKFSAPESPPGMRRRGGTHKNTRGLCTDINRRPITVISDLHHGNDRNNSNDDDDDNYEDISDAENAFDDNDSVDDDGYKISYNRRFASASTARLQKRTLHKEINDRRRIFVSKDTLSQRAVYSHVAPEPPIHVVADSYEEGQLTSSKNATERRISNKIFTPIALPDRTKSGKVISFVSTPPPQLASSTSAPSVQNQQQQQQHSSSSSRAQFFSSATTTRRPSTPPSHNHSPESRQRFQDGRQISQNQYPQQYQQPQQNVSTSVATHAAAPIAAPQSYIQAYSNPQVMGSHPVVAAQPQFPQLPVSTPYVSGSGLNANMSVGLAAAAAATVSNPTTSHNNASLHPPRLTASSGAAIRVSNLHRFTTIDDVRSAFSPYGPIRDFYLYPSASGYSSGVAMVLYPDRDCCQKAINALNNIFVDGLVLCVEHFEVESNRD